MQLAKPLTLASGSAVRASLLRGAGLDFQIIVPQVDESLIKQEYHAQHAQKNVEELALILAQAKAHAVRVDGFVIGADQLLQCDGRLFDKPRTLDEARHNLQIFRGRKHQLIGGVVLAQSGKIIWEHVAQVDLTMRDFSDAFLDAYLAEVGDKILASVGGYQLEGAGVHLFEHIGRDAGDYFSILGLPLLPLLQALRHYGGGGA